MEYETYIPRILIRWSLNCLNVKHRFLSLQSYAFLRRCCYQMGSAKHCTAHPCLSKRPPNTTNFVIIQTLSNISWSSALFLKQLPCPKDE